MANGILDALLGSFRGLALFVEEVPILPCTHRDNVGALRVRCIDPVKANAAVAAARVTITASDGSTLQDFTDGTSYTLSHVVPAGNYRVEAWHHWHVPQPAASVNVQVTAGQTTTETLNLEELRFYLHVDADRDGAIDNVRSQGAPWTWGAGGQGAVVLCNLDDDGNPPNAADNADAAVNGGNDGVEVAPLEVRRVGSAVQPDDTWRMELKLEAGQEIFVRILAGRAQGDAEIIGPGTGVSVIRSLRNFATTTYGIEAIRFPGRYGDDGDFDGVVEVTLTVGKVADVNTNPNQGNPVYRTRAFLRVAPWMIPHHGDRADTVYIASNAVTLPTRQSLAPHLGPIFGDCQLVQHVIHNNHNRWMQDGMEIGYTNSPAARIDVVARAAEALGPPGYPATLLGADMGYLEPGSAHPRPAGANGTGNLEVTPPCQARDGSVFPWGRIYFSHGTVRAPFDMGMQTFLEAQRVQAPVQLDASWLRVGHVDEMMSFIPWAGGPLHKQWKLLIASPRRAYAILDAAVATGGGGLNMLNGAQIQIMNGAGLHNHNLAMTVANFLNTPNLIADPDAGPVNAHISSAQLRNWNVNRVQARIERMFRILNIAINLDPTTDVIEIPVIFYPENVDWNRNAGVAWDIGDECAGPLSGDMVNMLVVNDHCIIPEAHGPMHAGLGDLFQHALSQDLQQHGMVPLFVDCWNAFHLHHGEIHCATNTLRRPANVGAWLGTAGARWWEFTP